MSIYNVTRDSVVVLWSGQYAHNGSWIGVLREQDGQVTLGRCDSMESLGWEIISAGSDADGLAKHLAKRNMSDMVVPADALVDNEAAAKYFEYSGRAK